MTTAPYSFRTDARGLIGPHGPIGPAFSDDLLRGLIATLYHDSVDEPSYNDLCRWQGALTAVEAFQPRDAVEAMLAAQAVATHHAVMEGFHHAMHGGLDEVGSARVRSSTVGLIRGMDTLLRCLERRQAKPLPAPMPEMPRVDDVPENYEETIREALLMPKLTPRPPRDKAFEEEVMKTVHQRLNEYLDLKTKGSPKEWYEIERELARRREAAAAAARSAGSPPADGARADPTPPGG